MTFNEFLIVSIITGCLSACWLIVLVKVGAIDQMQMRAYILGPFKDLPNCEFCMLFWLSFLIDCILALFCSEISYLVAPFVAAPIAKAIYENCRTTRR
jgi:hypothetical protein